METCEDCGEDYPMGELAFGLCADCKSNFDDMDAEDALERAMDL